METQIFELYLGDNRRVVAEIVQELPPENPSLVEQLMWAMNAYLPVRKETLRHEVPGGMVGPAILDDDGKALKIELGPAENLGRVRELPSFDR